MTTIVDERKTRVPYAELSPGDAFDFGGVAHINCGGGRAVRLDTFEVSEPYLNFFVEPIDVEVRIRRHEKKDGEEK